MRTALLYACLAVIASPSARAAPAATIGVTQAWSRPAAAGTNGAGFMVITNHGKSAVVLKMIESQAAKHVEMHQSAMAGGVMSMKRLDAGLALAPGQSVTFAPGGYHLMLVGLTKALKTGDRVPMTLVFADGARRNIDFPVRDGLGGMPGMDHMHH